MTDEKSIDTNVPPSARPRLARGARLQADRVTGGSVLLFPEGMLQLNPTGAAILNLCDGQRSLEDVVASLAAQFNATPDVLRADVAEYLQRLQQRRLVVLDDDERSADASPQEGTVSA